MSKTVLMKAGESIKEVRKGGHLFRNVINIEKMEANVTHMLPGSKTQGFKHQGQEIKIMLKGTMEYHVGDEEFILEEGDMLFHHSTEEHWSKNIGKTEAVIITISTPPTFTPFHRE
jgi:quercetin dioxygenase-like cupin family protein